MLHNQMEFFDMHNKPEYVEIIRIHMTGLLFKRWVDYFSRIESIDSGILGAATYISMICIWSIKIFWIQSSLIYSLSTFGGTVIANIIFWSNERNQNEYNMELEFNEINAKLEIELENEIFNAYVNEYLDICITLHHGVFKRLI